MAVDFPSSPYVGQVFSSGTRTWTWTGSYWSNTTFQGTQGTQGTAGSGGGEPTISPFLFIGT